MWRATLGFFSASALALGGCSGVGVEAIPCAPGCKDERTRIYCDAAGNPQTEACPASGEECAASACEAGACTFKPAVGAPCGEGNGAQCNEGFACLGGDFHLSAIRLHSCLAAADGKVWCWGDNEFQELGDGTKDPGLNPVLVSGLPPQAKQVSTGYAHTCALLRNGNIHCWGNNTAGQCAVAPTPTVSEPVLVDAGGVRFTAVASGQGHTCAIAEDKTVYCWGNTVHGQCGVEWEAAGMVVGPTKIPGLDSVESIVTVKNHTCAVQSKEPRMSCWGSNTHVEESYINYKLGPGAGQLAYSAIPIPVELDAPIVGAGMGFESTYALTEDGRVFAWGRNNRGQLGIASGASTTPTSTPAPVMIESDSGLIPLTGVKSINRSDGSDQCVTLREPSDFGSFMCWGGDDWGEVGAGTQEGSRTNHPYPIPVRAVPPSTTSIVRGEDHGCGAVVVDDRTEIWCYGRPGVLGNGTEPVSTLSTPSQWEGTPVIWKPENFARALSSASE
jgi:alpha-tubulin suppressor-like RCC1 family protein